MRARSDKLRSKLNCESPKEYQVTAAKNDIDCYLNVSGVILPNKILILNLNITYPVNDKALQFHY